MKLGLPETKDSNHDTLLAQKHGSVLNKLDTTDIEYLAPASKASTSSTRSSLRSPMRDECGLRTYQRYCLLTLVSAFLNHSFRAERKAAAFCVNPLSR